MQMYRMQQCTTNKHHHSELNKTCACTNQQTVHTPITNIKQAPACANITLLTVTGRFLFLQLLWFVLVFAGFFREQSDSLAAEGGAAIAIQSG